MMMNKAKIQLLFLGITIKFLVGSTSLAQGLQFYGNNYPIEQRTSYTVFDQTHSPQYTQYLHFCFDLNIQDFSSFGYLLHLTDPQNGTAYSLTYTYIDESSSAFKFNTEGKTNHISITFINDSLESRWFPVELHIDLISGQSILKIAGKTERSTQRIQIPSPLKPILGFGSRDHLLDVPSFAIRNLKVTGNKHSYSFPLNESKGEDVHDEQGKPLGKVRHPYWLINDAYHWKNTAMCYSNTPIGSNFNKEQQAIVFFNQDSLYTYQVDTKQLLQQAYTNKMPVKALLARSFIDEANQKMYAYEINSLPSGNTTLAALDINTLTWEAIGTAFTPVQLHRHNGFWDSERNRYFIFGGFGNRQYSNKFIFYNKLSDRWDTLSSLKNQISPRFNASIATSPEEHILYIYGGIGNDSGDQSIGHNYYNDLYQVDLSKQMVKKLWNRPLKEKLVPSSQMVLSPDKKHLYVLRYPDYVKESHLQLYRISIEDGAIEELGDAIPLISGTIESSVNLYYNPTLQEFYCVILEFNNGKGTNRGFVYTLSAPPVTKAAIEIYATSPLTQNHKYLFVVLFVLAIAVVIYIMYFFYRHHNHKIHPESIIPIIPAKESFPLTPSISKSHTPLPTIPQRKASKSELNKVYTYGTFTVYGRSGRDITHLFSNKLKLIFLYVLLNSTKEGVSSPLLNDLFWPDKEESKVKNLKGVTVSNLRKILAEIDGIKLIYERGFFRIIIIPPCYCDYFSSQTHFYTSEESTMTLISIWGRGKLLEGTNFELFDKYKQLSEDIIFSRLAPELATYYQQKKIKEVLSICAILQKRDPLCEPALQYAIYSYQCLNDYESISKIYAAFSSEYRNTMGNDYPKKLDLLLQEAKSHVFKC